MEFRLLGPLEVTEHERSLPLGGLKQRSLLAIMLLHANEVVSIDHLIDALWGATPPARPAKSVQVHISRLRKALGEGRLATRPPGYLLHVDSSELDLAQFERLVEEAARADAAGDARTLRQALALWRGAALARPALEAVAPAGDAPPPGVGPTPLPSAHAEPARLEELRHTALEQRIEADLAAGRHAELVGELEALVVRHPLRERPRRQLMLALYRSGRHAEALDAYRTARRVLSENL